MRLEHPALVMAAAPLVLALLLLARRGSSPGRRPALAFAVRFLILMTLAAVLASPSVASPAPRSSVVFALDVSDSVSDESLERAVEAIREASKAVSARGGTSSLILFAGRAAVVRPPSNSSIDFDANLRRRIFSRRAAKEAASEDRAQPREELEPLRTRAQSALLLARRLHPSGGDVRIVLLTDGEETDPGAQVSVGPGVRLIRLPKTPGSDVALRALHAPLAVRAGEAFDVEIDAWADRETEARLSLTLDGQVISEDAAPRTVRAGRSTLRIRSVQNALPQGLHRLQAFLSSDQDLESRNNSASASFNVVGKSRVLIAEATPADGEGLSRLLTAQGVEFDRRPLERLITGGIDLESLAVVVIAGATPAMIPASASKDLGAWLEDGGGLFYVASSAPSTPDSFNRPEFTKLLPVDLEPPKTPPKQAPNAPGDPGPPSPPPPTPPPPAPTPEVRSVLAPAVALLLVLDKSGSMAGDPITLCKEAALATLETLGPKDFLGVLAFDRQPVWLQKFESAHRTELIKRNILQLFADGGTELLPALEEARRAFQDQEFARSAGVKHIIVLSDGDVPVREYEASVKKLADLGVVVSTVCVVGPGGFNDKVMRSISRWGKGRYFFADSFQKVPRIFTEETKIVLKEAAAKADKEPKAPPAPPPPGPPPPPTDHPPDPNPAPPPSVAPGAGGKIVFKDEHEVIRGIPKEPAPPPLAGALAGQARRTSYVPLAFEDGAPALALWRYGLGRTAVWMSDFGGPWSSGWDKWPGTTKLFVQIVRHLSNAAEDVGLASAVRAERKGNVVEFRVDDNVAIHELAPNRRELVPALDGEGERKFVLRLDGSDVRRVSISRVSEAGRLELEFAPGPTAEIAAPPDGPVPFAWTTESPVPLERLTAESLSAGTAEPEARTPVGLAFLMAALLLIPVDVAVRRIP